MNRRRTGIVFGVAVLVGVALLVLLFSPLSGPPSVSKADTQSLNPALSDPYQEAKKPSDTIIQVGSGESGLPIRVWNDNSGNRTVLIKLYHNASDSVLINRTETLAPNGALRLEILSADRYYLTITERSSGMTGTYAVTLDRFDCNEHLATVRINETDIDSKTMQTGQGCGGIPISLTYFGTLQ